MINKQIKLQRAKDEMVKIAAAIDAILSGAQEYRIGSRSLRRADLEFLYKRQIQLQDLIDALTGGNGRFRRAIPTEYGYNRYQLPFNKYWP